MRHGLIGALLAITAAGLLTDPVPSLALAAVVLLAVAAVICGAADTAVEVPGFARAARQELVRIQRPARQCDPDAAGHIRSRAPGQFA